MSEERCWIFAVAIEDAPGSLLDVVATFSYRGVSLQSVLGMGGPISRTGIAILGVRCSERRAAGLDRVVRRLPVASAVHRFPAPPAETHRVVLVERREPAAVVVEGVATTRLADRWELVSGPEPAVRACVRGGIDRGEVGRHVEILLE